VQEFLIDILNRQNQIVTQVRISTDMAHVAMRTFQCYEELVGRNNLESIRASYIRIIGDGLDLVRELEL